MNDKSDLIAVKNKLDSVSSSFCAAKWTQVTLHLQNGMNHSCHHPRTHVVSLDELKRSASALHNTQYKKELRKQMLEGTRPTECDYCWTVEDSNTNSISDRIYKSGSEWSWNQIDNIIQHDYQQDYKPSYLEVSFSHVCNFKCSYCYPHISSKWMEEIEQWGPYPTTLRQTDLNFIRSENKMPIPLREHNPYVEAFWRWWPEIESTLLHFRITGGEPLLSRETFRVLEHYITNKRPSLNLSINSNLCVPEPIWNKFLETLDKIYAADNVYKIEIFTSAEAYNDRCDYIRHGMNYQTWQRRVNELLTRYDRINLVVMSTYNLLSISSFNDFLTQTIIPLKTKFIDRLMIDIPYLRNPNYLSMFIAPEWMLDLVREQQLTVINSSVFTKDEQDRMTRIFELFESQVLSNNDYSVQRSDFIKFIDEHDHRRHACFLEVFPEYTQLYIDWKRSI